MKSHAGQSMRQTRNLGQHAMKFSAMHPNLVTTSTILTTPNLIIKQMDIAKQRPQVSAVFKIV